MQCAIPQLTHLPTTPNSLHTHTHTHSYDRSYSTTRTAAPRSRPRICEPGRCSPRPEQRHRHSRVHVRARVHSPPFRSPNTGSHTETPLNVTVSYNSWTHIDLPTGAGQCVVVSVVFADIPFLALLLKTTSIHTPSPPRPPLASLSPLSFLSPPVLFGISSLPLFDAGSIPSDPPFSSFTARTSSPRTRAATRTRSRSRRSSLRTARATTSGRPTR